MIASSSEENEVFASPAKTPSRRRQKLKKLPREMTPDSIRDIMRRKLSSTEEKTRSPSDQILRRQVYRDFSPSPKKPAKKKPVKPAVRKPVIRDSETQCGFPKCPLEKLDKMTSKQFKLDLNVLIPTLYGIYNKSIFNYGFPRDLNYISKGHFRSTCKQMEIYWNKNLRSTAGRCRSGFDKETRARKCQIELAPHILDRAGRLRDTLLHEMIHAANWVIDQVQLIIIYRVKNACV